MRSINKILFCICCVLFCTQGMAQRDTSKQQSIDITSAYRPVLRNSVKINFSGSQLPADTSKRISSYNIPSQNLFYSYQPIPLKPLAIEQDTSLYLGNRFVVKAGIGNYSTPYLDASGAFGDGRVKLINLNAFYIQSTGSIKNQDYSILKLSGAGSYFTPTHEIYGSAKYRSDNYYLYGYDHSLYDLKKEEISQEFQEFSLTAGTRNTAANDLHVSYNPNASLSIFSNRDKVSETTATLELPAEMYVGENLLVKAAFKGDFTSYSTKNILPDNISLTNNVLSLRPSIQYAKQQFKIHAGIAPVWDNGEFTWVPDVFLEIQMKEKIFMFQAGWIGRIEKQTYRNLARVNPYIRTLVSQFNTRETEFFGGIKGTLGNHFNVNAKASWIHYENFSLFLNDTTLSGKGFSVGNEQSLNDLRIHADVSYINQDKFTFTGGITLNGYTGMQTFSKAWNTIPMELNGSMRWWAFKKLLLKSDLYIFGGGNALVNGGSVPFNGGSDLSVGLEYKINKQFSAWFDANNLLDDRYERWRNYPVYGLNVLGGIIVNF